MCKPKAIVRFEKRTGLFCKKNENNRNDWDIYSPTGVFLFTIGTLGTEIDSVTMPSAKQLLPISRRILFIDDERDYSVVISERYRSLIGLPAFSDIQQSIIDDDCVDCARTYDEAIDLLKTNVYDMIFFDHDLGHGKTGKDVANWIVNNISKPFEFYVHLANPIGEHFFFDDVI